MPAQPMILGPRKSGPRGPDLLLGSPRQGSFAAQESINGDPAGDRFGCRVPGGSRRTKRRQFRESRLRVRYGRRIRSLLSLAGHSA